MRKEWLEMLSTCQPGPHKQLMFENFLLSSVRGETPRSVVSPANLTRLCKEYRGMELSDRRHALRTVVGALTPSRIQVKKAADEVAKAKGYRATERALHELSRTTTPLYTTMVRQIMASEGLRFVIGLREDLLRFRSRDSMLSVMETHVREMLIDWMNPGFLLSRQIEQVSPEMATKETVHPVVDANQLQDRFSSDTRQCFGLFHPSMQDKPIAYIQVWLGDHMASSMEEVFSDTSTKGTCAVFYSINAMEPGLKGIDLGHTLIRQVTSLLEVKGVSKFCTLSPVPGFKKWLSGRLFTSKVPLDWNISDNSISKLHSIVFDQDYKLLDEMRQVLMHLCIVYLTEEKRHHRAMCPVAKYVFALNLYLTLH